MSRDPVEAGVAARRFARWPLVAAAALLALLVAGGAALYGLLRTEAGAHWLLARLPGITVEAPQGLPTGDRFAARRIRVAWAGGAASLVLDEVSWEGARWTWFPDAGTWLDLHIDRLRIRQLTLDTGPASDERTPLPRSLRLPLRVAVRDGRIERAQVGQAEPLQDIGFGLAVGAERGARHALELRGLRWKHVQARGDARIAADAPFALDLRARADGEGATPWTADARARGPLSSFELGVTLGVTPAVGAQPTAPTAPTSTPAPAAPAATLQATTQIRPFEAWPLGDVSATTRALDLSSILPEAPRTRLDGRLRIASQGVRQPIAVQVELDNALPGRFGEGGLPVHSLRLSLQADPRRPDRLVIGPFELQAADGQGAAGRWSGSGTWEQRRLVLQTHINALQPQRLARQLPPMRLSGPLDLQLDGLPSPDPQAAGSAAWEGWQALQAAVKGQLEGRVAGAPEDVALNLDLRADRRQIDLLALRGSSGGASARLQARASRAADGRWSLLSQGELVAFDPAVWLPGFAVDAAGRGLHRLNARWNVDLALPTRGGSRELAQQLAATTGRATLELFDSRVAGLPAQGRLEWQQAGAAARDRPMGSGRAELRLASAQLTAQAALDANGEGRQDQWTLDVRAPDAAELAPLADLVPDLRSWRPERGRVELHADGHGRWPAASIDLKLSAGGLRAGPLGVGKAEGSLRWDRRNRDTGALQLQASELTWRDARLDSLKARLEGTPDEHRFEFGAAAPGEPAAPLANALRLTTTGRGSAARVSGRGRWSPDAAGGGRWAGELQRLWLGPRDERSGEASAARWLDSSAVQLEARFDARGAPQSAQAQPGRASLGPLQIRWTEAQWQAGGTAADSWRLDAGIEPVAVAPWLQQLQAGQPGALQWSGDLRASARMAVRAGAGFDADIQLQRDGGDLRFSDGTTTQELGLGQADIRLSAHEGVWRLQPRIQGARLGRIGGEWQARTAASDRWPGPGAALSGQVDAQVPALEAWSTWLPPGWRVQGEMDAQARLTGTVRAPGYAGYLRLTKAGLRNVLQGVDLNGGTLDVQLEGDQARIETLELRAGEGRLTARGSAVFGARPELTLTMEAEKFRVLGRVDRQLVLSGRAALNADTQRLRVDGRLAADSGLFDLSRRDAPALDDDVSVSRSDVPEPPEPARREPTPMMRSLQVALDLDLGPRLRLRGRGLDTLLTGTLKLTAPTGRPQLQGTVRAERGTYAAYGQKLDIERGLVILAGPLDGARLDVLALRPNLDTRVGVAITGLAIDPRVRLYSEPDMSDTDKLSWLVLGRGPDGLGRTDTALLQRAALALLAGEGESPSTAVLRAIGLDDFSIRQSDGEVRETVVSVGKQISRRWYVGYERGVNATSGTWQLIYRAAQRFTLRAQSGTDNSIDLIWTWRFGGR